MLWGMNERHPHDPFALDRERSVPCISGAHAIRSRPRTYRRNGLCDGCSDRARAALVDVLAATVVEAMNAVMPAPSSSD